MKPAEQTKKSGGGESSEEEERRTGVIGGSGQDRAFAGRRGEGAGRRRVAIRIVPREGRKARRHRRFPLAVGLIAFHRQSKQKTKKKFS